MKGNNIVFVKEDLPLHQKKLFYSISGQYEELDEVIEELDLTKYLQEIDFPNDNISFELKCMVCFRIKNGEWKIKSFRANFKYKLIKFCEFLNKYYPGINSILEVGCERLCSDWERHLSSNGIESYWYYFDRKVQKDYKSKTSISNFPKNTYVVITTMLDNRPEWEKDIWNVLDLKRYGVGYNTDFKCKTVNFTKVYKPHLREELKVYFKEKLLDNKEITWNTLRSHLGIIVKFLNYLKTNNIEISSLSGVSEDLIKQYEKELVKQNKSGVNRAINTISTIVNNIRG